MTYKIYILALSLVFLNGCFSTITSDDFSKNDSDSAVDIDNVIDSDSETSIFDVDTTSDVTISTDDTDTDDTDTDIVDEVCFYGDYEATTVAELDEIDKYNCIKGNLIINKIDNITIINVDTIVQISGNLLVAECDSLQTLSFNNLKDVDGTVQVAASPVNSIAMPVLSEAGSFKVAGLHSLQAVNLPLLKNLLGELYISGDPGLESVELPSVGYIKGQLLITGNSLLASLNLESLSMISGDILISGNFLMSQMNMDNVVTINSSSVDISYNGLPYCTLCKPLRAAEAGAISRITNNSSDACCSTGECTSYDELSCP